MKTLTKHMQRQFDKFVDRVGETKGIYRIEYIGVEDIDGVATLTIDRTCRICRKDTTIPAQLWDKSALVNCNCSQYDQDISVEVDHIDEATLDSEFDEIYFNNVGSRLGGNGEDK